LKEIYGSEVIGNYLLVYLSTDDLGSNHLAKLSEEQVAWLASLLASHKNLPTIVFFHAPLAAHNTDLERKNPWTNVLYLHPEKFIVRTYDHGKKNWRQDLERTVRPPGT
jgi:hypothetical protein